MTTERASLQEMTHPPAVIIRSVTHDLDTLVRVGAAEQQLGHSLGVVAPGSVHERRETKVRGDINKRPACQHR